MSAREISLAFLRTGLLLGCGLDASPADWDSAFGDDDWPLADIRRRRMRRDYGLAEVTFNQVGEDWVCETITLQLHRLSHGDYDEIIPPKLRETLRPDDARLDVGGLLSAYRGQVELIDDRDRSQFVRYWIPDSKVVVVGEGDAGAAPGLVWSIWTTPQIEAWIRPQT